MPQQYRASLMDKLGPDAPIRIKLAVMSLPFPVIVSAVLAYVTQSTIVAVAFFVISYPAILGIGWLISEKTSLFVGRLVVPTGDSTPYEESFSFEMALVQQGRAAEASEAYAARVRMRPEDVRLRLVAAEHEANHGSADSAVAMFRAARQMRQATAQQRIYASHRLIDLYHRRPDSAHHVTRELRYIASLFPDSRAGLAARDALSRDAAQAGKQEYTGDKTGD